MRTTDLGIAKIYQLSCCGLSSGHGGQWEVYFSSEHGGQWEVHFSSGHGGQWAVGKCISLTQCINFTNVTAYLFTFYLKFKHDSCRQSRVMIYFN